MRRYSISKTVLLILLTYTLGACNSIKKADEALIMVTTNTRSQEFEKHYVPMSKGESKAASTITIDPKIRYQTMDGFGAAVTGSTCFNLMQMSKENRTMFLKETFSPTEGLGQSYIRISIGCSDF